jgi:hypothetical protein
MFVVNMTHHYSPIVEEFNMVKHHPRILHLSTTLHALN